MKKMRSLLIALSCCLAVQAQQPMTIAGTVLDPAGKPVTAATVLLLKNADTSLQKTTVTDGAGRFEITGINAGSYKISVTATGFEAITTEPFVISTSAVNLQPITLKEAVKAIGGVTVTAKRPFIETRIDKTVVNVDASPTSAGATALEVLEKSPGIMVSNDGAISLRGKAGVIVMMDGKQTFLSPTDLANLLKNLPASAIDQIEIMTNPSARFDAAGNSGVINIKTKKGQAGGFNGSVMVGLTTSFYEQDGNLYVIPKSQNSFNFNYRRNKVNFFGNYNPNSFSGRSFLQLGRTILEPDMTVTGSTNVETRFKFGNRNHTLKLGTDWYMDKKNTLGIVVSGFQFAGHPTPNTTTITRDPDGVLLETMKSYTDNRINFRNFTSNLNYRHVYDSTGRELTSDIDVILYDNTSRMQLATDFYDGNGDAAADRLLLKGRLPAKIRIYSAKTDYVHPFKKGGKLEAGLKVSHVTNDNLVDYTRWSVNKWVNDKRSNHFTYDETISAAYVNANTQLKKWSFQGGLRLENTTAKGHQVSNDSTFRRNFTNLFPSAFVSYAVSKQHQLTVSYSRRITRPNYQDLNPFIYFLDTLSYRKGNPYLLPQFTHNMELSHAWKGKFITTVNYNVTDNVISQILKPDGNLIYLTAENVSRFRNVGVSITTPLTVTKWWSLNLFTNIYNNRYKGIYRDKPLDISYTSFMLNMTQTFTLKEGFTLELSGFYRAKGVDQLTVNEPMYLFSWGGQKTVLKGKGTVRLNVRDPFWVQRYKGATRYDIVDNTVANRWDNRSVTASFTYKFGKTVQNQQQRRRASASQDEQNRIGQGAQ